MIDHAFKLSRLSGGKALKYAQGLSKTPKLAGLGVHVSAVHEAARPLGRSGDASRTRRV